MAAVFGSVFGWAAAASAADVGITANSVLRTYNDYCDPTFFDQNYTGNGSWDEALSANYARVLFTRYGNNCERFRLAEVVVHLRAVELRGRFPELQQGGKSTLNAFQREILGMVIWIGDRLEEKCELQRDSQRAFDQLVDSTSALRAQAVESDAVGIARGYLGIERLIRFGYGLPAEGEMATSCSASGDAVGIVAAMAVNLGVVAEGDVTPADGRITSHDFLRELQEDSDGQPSASKDSSTARKIEGWWRFADLDWGCEDEDNQYRVAIGRWTRRDGEIQFGEGSPKISLYEHGCELSDFFYGGPAEVGFHAQCVGEEQAEYSGQGEVYLRPNGELHLFLPGLTSDGVELVRCPVGQTAQ